MLLVMCPGLAQVNESDFCEHHANSDWSWGVGGWSQFTYLGNHGLSDCHPSVKERETQVGFPMVNLIAFIKVYPTVMRAKHRQI